MICTMRGLRIPACGVALATATELTVGLLHVLEVIPSRERDWIPLGVFPFLAVALLAPTVVGLLIALQLPRNPSPGSCCSGHSRRPPAQRGAALRRGVVASSEEATTPLLFAWPIAIAFVFPNGRLLSRRWRWVAGAAVVCFATVILMTMFDPSPIEPPNQAIRNPVLGNRFGEFVDDTGLWIPFVTGMLASLFAGVLAVVLRFRRSSGVERLQMLWLVWAAMLTPLAIGYDTLANVLLGGGGQISFMLLMLAEVALVASIGIAVVRYRLYAIERLVNRTLVYVTLSLLLVAAYAAITLALGVVVAGGSDWVVALATLVVAVAFRPLRSRVQDLVDRRFSRARYQGVRRVREFEDEVREGRHEPEAIVSVLAEALRDPLATLFFWLPASETYADASGELVATLPRDARAHTHIEREGAHTAVLLHDPGLLESRTCCAAFSRRPGSRSRSRGFASRFDSSSPRSRRPGHGSSRRATRNAGASSATCTTERSSGSSRSASRSGASSERSRERLRSSPPRSIRSWTKSEPRSRTCARSPPASAPRASTTGLPQPCAISPEPSPVPVDVDARGGRVAASVEAAAYFVACEALTNAVKHASASQVALRAVRENGALLLSVSDDGIGGAVARRGSGLAGLEDRVAAHGGTLEIVSPSGDGTRIEVAIPCDS